MEEVKVGVQDAENVHGNKRLSAVRRKQDTLKVLPVYTVFQCTKILKPAHTVCSAKLCILC